MLSLVDFCYHMPDTYFSVTDLERQTDLPKSMLSVFQLIYGLRRVPIFTTGDPHAFYQLPIDRLLQKFKEIKNIRMLIYVHTAPVTMPFGFSLLRSVQDRFGLSHVLSFSMTQYKCVSFFKALSVLQNCLQPNEYALILTGEIAFTPKLRVVPRTTIVGDAAAAALIGAGCGSHQLLSLTIDFIPGYEAGIYLTEIELMTFDSIFIARMADVIKKTLLKARLTLEEIAIILPHNVNIPTWQKIAAALPIVIHKIYLDNIPQFSHCFCSDQIINLSSAIQSGRLNKGNYYVMAACGVGFYMSAAVFRF